MRIRRLPVGAAAVLATVLAGLLTGAGPASADQSWWRGPAPTQAGLAAASGPFATTSLTVSDAATPGFGAATVHYPTDTSRGSFGGVAVVPGAGGRSTVAWLGQRLASEGFVVIVLDTTSRTDRPAARGAQLLAALDYVTTASLVSRRVDPRRLAVVGHSTGGRGALEAATSRPSLRAAVALTPHSLDRTWPEVRTPTLVVGAAADRVAPVSLHAAAVHDGLTGARERAYLELGGAGHLAPTRPDAAIGAAAVAWLKRFVDTDTRYTPFLCPGPPVATGVSAARTSCPV